MPSSSHVPRQELTYDIQRLGYVWSRGRCMKLCMIAFLSILLDMSPSPGGGDHASQESGKESVHNDRYESGKRRASGLARAVIARTPERNWV